MTDAIRRAISPLVSVAPGKGTVWTDTITASFREYGLDALIPRFMEVSAATKVLPLTTSSLPQIQNVSFTDPEVLALWFESYSAAEPSIEFASFCKGVACASFLIDERVRMSIRDVLELAANHAIETGTLPALEAGYEPIAAIVLQEVFENGEPTSWRSLIAFTFGALWITSFLAEDPATVKVTVRGAGKDVAALDYLVGMLIHYAQLAHLPQ